MEIEGLNREIEDLTGEIGIFFRQSKMASWKISLIGRFLKGGFAIAMTRG